MRPEVEWALGCGEMKCPVTLWDVESGRRLWDLGHHANSVTFVAFSPVDGLEILLMVAVRSCLPRLVPRCAGVPIQHRDKPNKWTEANG